MAAKNIFNYLSTEDTRGKKIANWCNPFLANRFATFSIAFEGNALMYSIVKSLSADNSIRKVKICYILNFLNSTEENFRISEKWITNNLLYTWLFIFLIKKNRLTRDVSFWGSSA